MLKCFLYLVTKVSLIQIVIIFSGLDGKYKVWDYTRIGYARRKGKEILEIQPTFQRKIQDNFGIAKPLSFQKIYPDNPYSEMYFMQARNSLFLFKKNKKKNNKALLLNDIEYF